MAGNKNEEIKTVGNNRQYNLFYLCDVALNRAVVVIRSGAVQTVVAVMLCHFHTVGMKILY